MPYDAADPYPLPTGDVNVWRCRLTTLADRECGLLTQGGWAGFIAHAHTVHPEMNDHLPRTHLNPAARNYAYPLPKGSP